MKIGIKGYDGQLNLFEGSGHEVEVYVFVKEKHNNSSYRNFEKIPENLYIILDDREDWNRIYKYPGLLEYISGFGFEENSKRFLDEFINEVIGNG